MARRPRIHVVRLTSVGAWLLAAATLGADSTAETLAVDTRSAARPMAWDARSFYRTPASESMKLGTNARGEDMLLPIPLSNASQYGLPARSTPTAYVVASRRIPEVRAGDVIDANATIEVSDPECTPPKFTEADCRFPGDCSPDAPGCKDGLSERWTTPDAARGRFVLAASPSDTEGAVLVDYSGGRIPGNQHHDVRRTRGTTTLAAGDGILGREAENLAARGDDALYVNFVLEISAGAKPNTFILNAPTSHLAVTRHRAATGAEPRLAVEAHAKPVERYDAAVFGHGESPPAIVWSEPIGALAKGQVLVAHADLGFTLAGADPSCLPIVDAGFYLASVPRPNAHELSVASFPMTQSTVGVNLTTKDEEGPGEGAPTNTVSVSGALAIDDALLKYTHVVLAVHQGNDWACKSGAHVALDPSASNASFLRYRAAAPGERSFAILAASSRAGASAARITPGTSGFGADHVVFRVAMTVQAGDVVDATGAAELANPGQADPLVSGALELVDGATRTALAPAVHKAFDRHAVHTDVTCSATYVVPTSFGGAPRRVEFTYAVAARARPSQAPEELTVDAHAGGLSVVLHRPVGSL